MTDKLDPRALLEGTTPDWSFEQHDKHSQWLGNIIGTYGVNETGSIGIRTIACLLKYGPASENEANARLCAAAPQLARDCIAKDEEIAAYRASLGGARAALQAMMDTWLDYHDAHSLTRAVTGASGNAFDVALEARDNIDTLLADKEQDHDPR